MKTNDEIQALLDTAHRDAGLPDDVEFSCWDYYPPIYGRPPDPKRINIMWYCERGGKEYGFVVVGTREAMTRAIKELVASATRFLEKVS